MVLYALYNNLTGAYRQSGGTVIEFSTKEMAQSHMIRSSMSTSQWDVVEWDNAPWRREVRTDYQDGTLIKPLWYNERWHLARMEKLGLYPSVNPKDKMLIDYYPTLEKAEKGQSQSTKPGKYLKAFYGDVLNETQIKDWSERHKEEFANSPTLRWAKTPEEIERVYSMDAGFNSCMQKNKSHWGGLHPTRAYGAGDLAIAYIAREGYLLARALVWPEKKKVGRVYGEAALLRNALRTEGINTKSDSSYYDSMEGAKLLYIPLKNKARRDSYVGDPALLPYIDSRDSIYGCVPDEKEPDKLVLVHTSQGQFQAIDQGGVIHPTRKCECCGKVYNAVHQVITKPGFTQHANRSEYVQYYCATCMNKENVFKDSAYALYFSKKTYTPVPFWYYDYDYSPYGKPNRLVAKEALVNGYFISDETGYVYRDSAKVIMGGKQMSVTERGIRYGKSGYDGQWYEKNKLINKGSQYYTKEQLDAISASAFDLFLRSVNNKPATEGLGTSASGYPNSTGVNLAS